MASRKTTTVVVKGSGGRASRIREEPRNAREERIARLYRDKGLSSPAIGERIGLNASTVARTIRRLGLTRPNGWAAKPVAANKARNERIEKLYGEGLTAERISEKIGYALTPSGVLQVLRARGVARRQSGSWVPPRPAEFYEIRDLALSVKDILGKSPDTSAASLARRHGVSVEAFRAHLRRLGIKARMGMGAARLSVDDVVAIRRLLVRTKRSFASLGEEFGVNHRTINSIAMGHTWPEAPWPEGKSYVRRRPERKVVKKTVRKGAPRGAAKEAGRTARGRR